MNINLDLLGGVVRNVGTPGFGQALFSLFKDAFGVRLCSVFAFPKSGTPYCLVAEGETPDDTAVVRELTAEYVNGSYRDDPNVSNFHIARLPSVYCMRADELSNTKYRQRFYDEPRVSYELVQLSSVEDELYYVSVYRDRRAGPFHSNDVIAMRKFARFVVPAARRHSELGGVRTQSQSADEIAEPASVLRRGKTPMLLEHMRQTFLKTPQRLSPREAEVCAGIVLGYSSIAISLNLQIAVNTVMTHRKRAYKKLGVCSQGELFARYFESVRRLQDAA